MTLNSQEGPNGPGFIEDRDGAEMGKEGIELTGER